MSNFDPAAATAAYIAQMPPAAQAKAVAYTHGSEWLILGGWVASMVVAWLILRSGVLVGVRGWIESARSRPLLASLVVGLAYSVIGWVLGIPWAVYSKWWFEKSFGLTSQSLSGFMLDGLKVVWLNFLISPIFLMLLYLALRRAPKTWWIWGSGLACALIVFAVLITPVVIEPLLNTYKPAPPGPVLDAVVALGKKTGTPTDKIYIYDGSKQSNRYTANVSGLGGSARVALSDVMFKKGADLAEVRGVVGHEMGHYVHQHTLWFVGIFTLLAVVAFWLVDRLFHLFARVLGAKGVKGLADPAGLPVLFAVIATLGFVGTPVLKSITRITEADADNFSLRYANEPDGLSKALIKTAEYRAPTPSKLEEILFYDHPSVGNRIRHAMDWKATHLPKAEK